MESDSALIFTFGWKKSTSEIFVWSHFDLEIKALLRQKQDFIAR